MVKDRTPTTGGRRWYDRYPDISAAFAQLKTMDEDYQALFGQVIYSFYEKLTEKKKLSKELLSLGSDRALGLYNTRSRRRAEDTDPGLFRSMTVLFMIEEPLRGSIAEKISIAIRCLQHYITACQKKYREQIFYEVKNLFMISLDEGEAAGKAYLKSLGLLMEFTVSDEEKARKVDAAKSAFKRSLGSAFQRPAANKDIEEPAPRAEETFDDEAEEDSGNQPHRESVRQSDDDLKIQ